MNELKTITILFRAVNALEEEIKKDLSTHQINASEFGTLEVLFHKGPLPVGEIVEKVLIANSSMSYVLQQLTLKGLVQQRQCTKDKRRFYVELTPKGTDVISSVYEQHKTHMRQILDVLSQEEERTLQDLLKKLGKQNALSK